MTTPLDFLAGCEVERTQVERLTVVGPIDRFKEVLNSLHEHGYLVKRSGAYTDRKMHPNVDGSRFLFHAERELPR